MRRAIVVGVLGLTIGWAGLIAGVTTPVLAQAQESSAGVPAGEMMLGSVRISRRVLADGKPLGPGTYRLRLTAQAAQPAVAGQLADLNRWVDFLQGSEVRGREVASIVPAGDIKQITEGTPLRAGSTRVEMLKGNEFVRIWINRGGTHYLIHLPPAS